MFHKTVLMIVFAFAIGLVGCRSCWGPYDHCQPTFVPEAGDQCMGELYRNGSILGGMDRRGNCGGCQTCSGGMDYGYEAGYGADYGTANDSGYETYDDAYAQPVQQQGYSPEGINQPLPQTGGAETIPTPNPNSVPVRDGIQDFMSDPNASFPLDGSM